MGSIREKEAKPEKISSMLDGIYLSPFLEGLTQILILVVMLFGLISLFTYIIPGLTIIWLAALVYGLLTGISFESIVYFLLITVGMVIGNSLDQILMGARARKSGAKWSTIAFSTLAAIIFSFIFPPFGGLIAALAVLFGLEFIRLRSIRQAGGSTREMAIGCMTAAAARFGVGLVMVGIWVFWVLRSGGFSLLGG